MYKENSWKERDKTHFFIGIVWIVPRNLVRGRSPDISIGKWNAEPGNLNKSRFYPAIYNNGTPNADLDCYNGTQPKRYFIK